MLRSRSIFGGFGSGSDPPKIKRLRLQVNCKSLNYVWFHNHHFKNFLSNFFREKNIIAQINCLNLNLQHLSRNHNSHNCKYVLACTACIRIWPRNEKKVELKECRWIGRVERMSSFIQNFGGLNRENTC